MSQEEINEKFDNIMITSLINEIRNFSEEITWANINVISFENRIKWIECFIEAKRRLITA